MSAGLFVVPCPECGDSIDLVEGGFGTCPGCHRTYLVRVGYLIAGGSGPGARSRHR